MTAMANEEYRLWDESLKWLKAAVAAVERGDKNEGDRNEGDRLIAKATMAMTVDGTTRIRTVGDLAVGMVMVCPENGTRVRVTSITIGTTVPDGPNAGRPMLQYTTVGIAPVDQLAGWVRPAPPADVAASWLADRYRVVTRNPGWDTRDWFEVYVAPECPPDRRAALRRAWLGDGFRRTG
ncbi:MAG: hypothetical protein ACRD0V_09150 [Acidimicrobiales bacterium]